MLDHQAAGGIRERHSRAARRCVTDCSANPPSVLVSRPCGTESLGHRARSEFRIRYEIVKAGRPWTTRGAEEGPSSTGALSSFKPTLHIVRKQRAVSAESRNRLGRPGPDVSCTDKRAPRGSARDTGWAMSQENVELLHRAYDAFNRRDLVAFLALCARDVEFISYWMEVEGGGSYRGDGGVRRWWESICRVPGLHRRDRGGTSPGGSRRYESLGT